MPQHVAAIALLRHWLDPAWHLRETYTLNVGDSQYLLYHGAGALLSLVTGSAEAANRALLIAAAVAYPLSLRALLDALDRDPRLAVFGAPAFWSAPLLMGFLPYVAAVPVTVWGLSLVVSQSRAPTRRRALGLSALACALFGLHASAYAAFVVTSAAIVLLLFERGRPRGLARVASASAWAIPSAALAVAWLARGSLARQAGRTVEETRFSGPDELAQKLPIWAHDIWRSHVDEGCAVVLWAAFLALLLQRGGRAPSDPRLARAAWAPFAVATLAYVGLPYHVGVASMLNLRMTSFIVLFAPLLLTPRRGLASAVALGAVLASHAVGVVDAAVEVRAAERDELGDIGRLIDRVPEGARIITLPFHLTSAHTHWPPWIFMGSYHVARAGGVGEMSFTELRHWPVRDREDVGGLPSHPLPFWTMVAPCDFRNAVDGRRLDYALVRGPRDPFAGEPAGPRWRKVDTERDWALYERVSGDDWLDVPGKDTATCPR